MKKDVLFLCQFFYPEYVSSATLPFDTARFLTRAGYTVDVLCGTPKEYYAGAERCARRETVDGIRISRIPYLQCSRQSKMGRLINYFSFTASMAARLLKMAQYKCIVVYSNPPLLPAVAAWAKRLFSAKLVFVAYDLYPEIALVSRAIKKRSAVERIMTRINKTVYSAADRVVALSSEMKAFMLENRGIDAARISVIPNWFEDEGRINGPAQEDGRFYGLRDKFVVAYFGSMGTMQDVETIVGAIRLLKDKDSIHFLFAGHGNKLQWLKAEVARERLGNVTICDFLHGRDYRDALAVSDCALISLIPNATGLCVPSKTYGYMMQGLALIAIMGESDIVRDIRSGAGRHVAHNDPAELAEAICSLYGDPAALKAAGDRCRALFQEKYTAGEAEKKYLALFNEVLQPGVSEPQGGRDNRSERPLWREKP